MTKEKIIKYQNQFNKEKYDHINVMTPKGKKEEWKQIANKKGISLNQLVIKAVEEYIKSSV